MIYRNQRFGWASAFVPWLALVLGTPHLGCSPPPGEGDDLGAVRLAIKQTPGDVRCIEITARGARTVTQRFPLSPGDSAELSMSGLALGDVGIDGGAFAETCESVTAASVPNWISDVVPATILKGVVAQVELVMHRNGRAAISVDFADDGCPNGYHAVSTGACKPIIFSDDFNDSIVSTDWMLWRKTFFETDGRMNVGDQPRPGFNYGGGANGREAVLATHVGDMTWTDYRLDVDARALAPGAYNPLGLPGCMRRFGISFRVARAAESWNAPAFTGYTIAMNPAVSDCLIGGTLFSAGSITLASSHDFYFAGTGCCTVGAGASTRTLLGEMIEPVFVDDVNHYAIEVLGQTIKLFVNGAPVFSYVDDVVPYATGADPITFGGIEFDWGWESLGWVDNVVVTDLSH